MKKSIVILIGMALLALPCAFAFGGYPQPFGGTTGVDYFTGKMQNRDASVTWSQTSGDSDTWYAVSAANISVNDPGNRLLDGGNGTFGAYVPGEESGWAVFRITTITNNDTWTDVYSFGNSSITDYNLVGIMYGLTDSQVYMDTIAGTQNIVSNGMIVDIWAVPMDFTYSDYGAWRPTDRSGTATFDGLTNLSGAERVLQFTATPGFETGTPSLGAVGGITALPTTPYSTFTKIAQLASQQWTYLSVTDGTWKDYFDNDRYVSEDGSTTADVYMHTEIGQLVLNPGDAVWTGESEDPFYGSANPVPGAAVLGLIGLGLVGVKNMRRKRKEGKA